MSEGVAVAPQIKVCTKELVPALAQSTIEAQIQRMSVQKMPVSLTQHAHHSACRQCQNGCPDKESVTNDPVKEFQDEGFNLEMGGGFTEHPGIRMEHRDDGTTCMTQKGPVEKIILTAKMRMQSKQDSCTD